jgi:D-alanyl-D-alanine carboxypeptidase/D-alanyl-D-alanine-endopeptidase (penicillin-binding protein 4)
MKSFIVAALVLVTFGPVAARADLADDLNRILDDKLLSKAQIGIEFARLDKDGHSTEICQANSTLPLVPASNLKVITTSAALDRLGSDFKFRTLLLQHDGDLIIMGDGDPTFGDAELLKKSGWDVNTVFKTWAAGLLQRNVKTVRNVLVDDSIFDQEFLHPNWPADQTERPYMAEVGGLNLNANCMDVYVQPHGMGHLVGYSLHPQTNYVTVKNTCIEANEDAVGLARLPNTNNLILRGKSPSVKDTPAQVTIHDPGLFTGTVLAETLKANGIQITGDVKRDRSARDKYALALKDNGKTWTLLAVHETPLLSVISRANKDSMNLYAECLCKRLGFARNGEGTWANGTGAVSEFLKGLKIPSEEYTLDDGCGLSKKNAISAHLMASVLAHDFFGPSSHDWLNCLSVAGEDGTLADRFRGTSLRGRVIGKSGFVNNVSCLSGYLHSQSDQWFCFSIMFNGIPDLSNSMAKAIQEKIVQAMDQYTDQQAASAQ